MLQDIKNGFVAFSVILFSIYLLSAAVAIPCHYGLIGKCNITITLIDAKHPE